DWSSDVCSSDLACAGGPATVAPIDLRSEEVVVGEHKNISRQEGRKDAAQALVATGFSYDAERRRRQARVLSNVLPHVRDIRRLGSAALDLCMVASGQVDGYYEQDRKSTRLNSSHVSISYAVFCLKKKQTPRPHRLG